MLKKRSDEITPATDITSDFSAVQQCAITTLEKARAYGARVVMAQGTTVVYDADMKASGKNDLDYIRTDAKLRNDILNGRVDRLTIKRSQSDTTQNFIF